LVQVVKEPGGEKGPKLTMNLTIPGNCVVLLPKGHGVGVSRHIDNPDIRKSLEQEGGRICPEGMGMIVRTAAAETDAAQLSLEMPELLKQWDMVQEDFRQKKGPCLIRSAGNLLERVQRDLVVPGETRILMDPENDDEFARAMEEIGKRRVWLESGGFLVIDPCEALTVIDVNSGKSSGKSSQEENIVKLNCEAAAEIAKQIRLRDMGGIIVIDFIDMKLEASQSAVFQALSAAMKNDRAKYHLHGFTATGLFELTRRPVQGSLQLSTRQICPLCRGNGTLQKEEIIAHEALRQIRRRRRSGDESRLCLKAHSSVLEAVKLAGLPENVDLRAENISGFTLQSTLGGDAT